MRPVPALLVVLVLVVVPLAGCTGAPSDDAVEPASSGNDTVSERTKTDLAGVDAPEWEALDWFEYEMSGPFTRAGSLDESVTYKVIVHAPTQDGYETGTDSEEQLQWDLFWGGDPLIGQMGHDLNPKDDRLPQLFDWPLEHNKTWQTEGFDQSWTFVAHARDSVQTHAGPMPGYHIVGEAESGWKLLLTYVPQMRWFSNWMVHNATDAMVINADMTDMGRDYSGEMYVGSSTHHAETVWQSTPDGPHRVTFDVAEEDSDLRLAIGQWSAVTSVASLHDPDGNAVWGPNVLQPLSGSFEQVHVDDPATGTWELVIESVGVGGTPVWGGGFLRITTMQIQSMTH